jgi:hypothetical protein
LDKAVFRRIHPRHWPALSKAVQAYAQERQIPFIADMNADFRDGINARGSRDVPGRSAA